MDHHDPNVRITCLGTGTSHGVPMIGCDCAVCTSDDPRDRRMRASILIECRGVNLLVDTGPEMRMQCLANGIKRVDAVLYTHHHADHVTGIDDLRRFNWILRRPLDCYGLAETLRGIEVMFPYVFRDDPEYPSHKPQLNTVEVATEPFDVFGCTITPIPLLHGPMNVLGFRVGRFAYCTDCNAIPASSLALLDGLDVLILDALRREPHPTHFTLDQAVAMARRIGAKLTYFTHVAHTLGHTATNAELPNSMALAHDGLVLSARL